MMDGAQCQMELWRKFYPFVKDQFDFPGLILKIKQLEDNINNHPDPSDCFWPHPKKASSQRAEEL